MARNGGTVTKQAKQPNELYDSLSLDAQDIWDQIGELGYVPEKGVANMWWAKQRANPKIAVGPAESLPVLLGMVKDDALEEQIASAAPTTPSAEAAATPPLAGGEPEMPTSRSSRKEGSRVKQPYLPGAEDIEELDSQADICLDLQDRKKEVTSAYKDARDTMVELLDKHKRSTYARGGWNMTVKESRVLELKQDKNRKTKKVEEADTVIDPMD